MSVQKSQSQVVGAALVAAGSLLLLIALPTTAFSGYHVFLDPRGAISAREAAPFFALGAVTILLAALPLALGAILMRAPAPPAVSFGAETAIGPRAPTLPTIRPQAGYPTHYLLAVVTALLLLSALVLAGTAAYHAKQSSHHRAYAYSGWHVDYRRLARANTERTNGLMLLGAGGMFFLCALGSGGATWASARRRRRVG